MKNKVLVCFGENLSDNAGFEKFADKFSQNGFQVHLFDKIVDREIMPHSVLSVLESVWGENVDDNEYFFLTDIKAFLRLTYRIYHQTFSQFIFFADGQADYDIDVDDIYFALLQKPINEKENIFKHIFVNDTSVDFDNEFLNSKKTDVDDLFSQKTVENIEYKQIIYSFSEECYMLEPVFGDVQYVALDDEPVSTDMKFVDIVVPVELDEQIIKQVEDIFALLSQDPETVLRRHEVLHKLFFMIKANILTSDWVVQRYYISLLKVIGESYGVFSEMFTLSFLMQVFPKSYIYQKLLSVCQKSKQLSIQNKYFILAQSRYVTNFKEGENAEAVLEQEISFFREISESFAEMTQDELKQLEDMQGEKDHILVITSRLSGGNDFSGGIALEVCKHLIEKGKQVWLINTCEHLSQNAKLPFFDPSQTIILSEYGKANSISYEGVAIPFIQMVNPMPNGGGIEGIAELVEYIKPSLLINVSELSVVAEIFSKYMKSVFSPGDDKFLSIPAGKCLLISPDRLTDVAKKIYADNDVEVVEFDENIKSENLLDNLLGKIEKFI